MKKIGILPAALFLAVCVASCGTETARTVDSSTQSNTESETVTTENKEEPDGSYA